MALNGKLPMHHESQTDKTRSAEFYVRNLGQNYCNAMR